MVVYKALKYHCDGSGRVLSWAVDGEGGGGEEGIDQKRMTVKKVRDGKRQRKKGWKVERGIEVDLRSTGPIIADFSRDIIPIRQTEMLFVINATNTLGPEISEGISTNLEAGVPMDGDTEAMRRCSVTGGIIETVYPGFSSRIPEE
ncbi:hypothetical protein DM860_007273 [Cuscuta australis]|uniref:Uncharacterized protein n=1 Tax=Cuscuta australis TaxID=267555 RepID=A0A328E4P0_9ASTE|nr:hypothetical protein DM860_007273 [Cuscuta australis]